VFDIDFKKLKDKGFKAVIFDIDSTLVPHGSDTTDDIDTLFKEIHSLDLKTLLLSNNSAERIESFNRNIKTTYIPLANKPYKSNFLKAIELLDVDKSEVVLIGDQLFTDVLGANLVGIPNILVQFLMYEHEVNIGKKRKVEKLLLKYYFIRKKYSERLKDIRK